MGVIKLELDWPFMLFMFIRPPKKGEFCRDEAILFFCLSYTMLSLRSADFISLPEFGSLFMSLILLFTFTLPVEKMFADIENLWPMLFVEDLSPVPMFGLDDPWSWPKEKLCLC